MAEKYTQEIIIEKLKIIHNNFYDYSLFNYNGVNNKVKIICPIHGEFEQIPNSHLSGCGCLKCANKDVTTDEFNKKASKVHNNIYDYSLSDYINSFTKIKIICKTHGMFEQTPNAHLDGSGCPKCNDSKGEIKIKKILDSKNINYEIQKTFKSCEYLKPLKFDFYLPKLNTCIEFDGEQHYNPVKYWGGEDTLSKIKERDKIKTDFCRENNIQLLRIRYDENIFKKLCDII